MALVAGYAVALDVGVVDAFLVRWYGAFYPELLSNMVVANNKPVFSFATHSMAGFVYYVLFYRQLLQWRQGGGWWAAATAFGYLSLGVLLTSTTGWAFGGVAAAQLAMELARSAGRYAALAVIAVALVGVAAATALGLAPDRMLDTVQTALVGDRVHRIFARYASDGLLASSIAYLSESPFAPIGFSATASLDMGDSGVVANLLRRTRRRCCWPSTADCGRSCAPTCGTLEPQHGCGSAR